MRHRCLRSSLLFLLWTAVATAAAQSATSPEPIVTTTHQMVLSGKPLAYAATAGRLPIIDDEAGEPHGFMFFVAYTIDPGPGKPPRPLTFIWNGGPGSSSSELHLMAFGPKRFKMGDTYPSAPPLSTDTPIEDNPETWLDFTDLVFVDPIGTGYSRPAKPKYAAEFYNTVGDAESVAEFIRVYRQRFDRFDSPLFLVGESYGTVRAQWVAEALERRRTTVSGVALISGFLQLDQHVPPAMEKALQVPCLTATAYYYKKLPPELQSGTLQAAVEKAKDWARSTYAPALERLDSLNPLTSAERTTIVSQLVGFTGVNPGLVDPKSLTIPGFTFTDRFLQDKGLDLGRYDTRTTGHRDVTKIPWTPVVDPSLSPVMDVMQGTSAPVIRYLRSVLQYKSDLLYRGPFGGAYPAPPVPDGDWMTVHWAHETPKGVPAYDVLPGQTGIPLVTPLHRAMELNPKLRVLIFTGRFDIAAPDIGCDFASYSVSQVDPSLRGRIQTRCYTGGHMIYLDKVTRQEMKRDMEHLERAQDVGASRSAN